MYHFWDILIQPVIERIHPKTLVEIGSDYGYHTELLLEFCKKHNAVLHAIDPVPKFNVEKFEDMYKDRFSFHKGLSLNMLPQIKEYDVILIDGDHNWYTVFHEFILIEKACQNNQRPFPLIFLHDTGWPYARRDLYYNPENIPEHFRKPYKKWGILPGNPELVEHGGINSHLFNSIYENNIQSGVLTATEDFLQKTKIQLEFLQFPGLSGLGIILPKHLKKQFPELSDYLKSFELNESLRKYIEKIETVHISSKIALTERLKENLKFSHTNEINKLRTAQQDQIDKLRTAQQDQISLLKKQNNEKINALKTENKQHKDQIDFQKKINLEQKRQIGLLQKQLSGFKNLAIRMRVGISEIKGSKRWRMGNLIAECIRKITFRPKITLVPDKLLAELNQNIGNLEPLKKKDSQPDNIPLKKVNKNNLDDLDFRCLCVPSNPPKNITIIIPVFNACEAVKQCMESVLKYTPEQYTILIIDDASTDQRILPLLQTYAKKHSHVELLKNKKNEGYTHSVNTGCKQFETDILLLNSDTIVTAGWASGLAASAYKSELIGTVTPVSNHAGAFSVPSLNTKNFLPEGYSLEEFSNHISMVSLRSLPEVPTGSGFCMYIKRKVFDAIGFFDEYHFPKGYGEENDFCIRARKAGFINVIDDSIYIFHHRTASFGNQKAKIAEKSAGQLEILYPEYRKQVAEFQKYHPLAYLGNAVKNSLTLKKDLIACNHQISNSCKKILYVLHDGGGGSILTGLDLARAVETEFKSMILFCGNEQWRLYDPSKDIDLYQFYFPTPWSPISPLEPQRFSTLKLICRIFDITIVHLRTLIGLAPEVIPFLKYIDVKVIFSIHDLYIVCPTIQLIDNNGNFCEGLCTLGDGVCPVSNKWYHTIKDLKNNQVYQWRQRMRGNIRYSDALITTSREIMAFVTKHVCPDSAPKFNIIEHGRDFKSTRNKPEFPETSKLKIVAFGISGIYKGSHLLKKIMELNQKYHRQYPDEPYFEFHLLGKIDPIFQDSLSYIVCHGTYQRNELVTILHKIQPAFAVIPSIIPESYSHTLTEAWYFGIPVFGSNLGAVKERIQIHGGGWLLNPTHPEQWFHEMINAAKDMKSYQNKVNEIQKINFKSTRQMGDDYIMIYKNLLNSSSS